MTRWQLVLSVLLTLLSLRAAYRMYREGPSVSPHKEQTSSDASPQ